MKKVLLIAVALVMATMSAQAQRRGCLHSEAATRAENTNRMPKPYDFDPERTYRVPVVLVSFSDMDFTMESPAEYYNRLFNEQGFNEGAGRGCVTDYFREQSGGRLNLSFDIYGPIKVSTKAGGRRLTDMYGDSDIIEAFQKLSKSETTDFVIYDWNDDNKANAVILIFAGYTGNQKDGYIWPNTGFGMSSMQLPGRIKPYLTSSSCELWGDSTLCGIGTLVHEFCHCLGLPDLYPMAPATPYSEFDEWDLMDGGNYVGKGWCPPNLSAMERMYLGWQTPIELTEPSTIRNLKSIGAGGESFIIRNSARKNEYYILENRQQAGWDYGVPGNGMLITHIDFSQDLWLRNEVNTSDSHFRCDLIHADGKDYLKWDPANNNSDNNRWTMEDRMRCTYLSTSSYPYTDPLTLEVNDALTDISKPAATLFQAAADGRKFLGKPITNIQQAADGTISFDFMGGCEGANIGEIHNSQCIIHNYAGAIYDLSGRRINSSRFTVNGSGSTDTSVFSVSSVPSVLPKGVYIVNGKKLFVK